MRRLQGCGERTLTVGPLRAHWERQHAAAGAKFEAIHTSITPLKPAPAPSKTNITPKPAITPSKAGATPTKATSTPAPAVKPTAAKPKAKEPEARAKPAERTEKEADVAAEDASPMVPVGRRVVGRVEAQACGHPGCPYTTESRRDLARHRRDTGHSKVR